MRVHEFVDEGLGHTSYVVDLDNATAAIIDPPRFVAAHEALAKRDGFAIVWTIDTHSHADYVTGSPGLAARVGATFVAPGASRLVTPHRPITDGERVALSAKFALVAIATPGHTPDHHAYVLEADGRPVAVFTGGSLMVATVGRTDLCGPDLARPLAHQMYRSLRRFDDFTDDVAVYPTHGAGSFCSAPGAVERTSTLGRERATNALLRTLDEDDFVERLVAGFATFPSYFARLPELNRQGPLRYDTVPALARLDANDLERRIGAGAIVVDARPFAAFGAGHIAGSLSNTLRPVFATFLGWLVAPDQPLVFVLDANQDRDELVRQCLDVGLETLIGELDGGIAAWVANERPLATIPVVDIEHVSATLVDVRQTNEYAAGHIPGSDNIELAEIANTELTARPLTLMCGHGERAMTAASILTNTGRSNVAVLNGGPDTWAAATRRPLDTTQ